MSAFAIAVLLVTAQTPGSQEEDLRDDLPPKAQPLETTDEFGRGGSGTVPAWREQALTLPRLRFGIGSASLIGVQTTDGFSSGYRVPVAGGLGLSAEAGVIFADRFTVMWRGELATSLGSVIGSNGAFFDAAFGDHFAIGIGAAFTLWSNFISFLDAGYTQPFQGFTFPLRAHWNFGSREKGVSRRSGLTLSAHFAPGFSTYPTYYERCFDCSFVGPQASSPFAFTAGAGLGYLWW